MLMKQSDGTYIAGSLDVLMILHDVNKDRYHAAFFEEKPMPGPIGGVTVLPFVRLQSKMHHTGGSDTLEGARVHLKELSEKIKVPGNNITDVPIEWDGELGVVLVVDNWVAKGQTIGPVACTL